jgi:hypothetical protein
MSKVDAYPEELGNTDIASFCTTSILITNYGEI